MTYSTNATYSTNLTDAQWAALEPILNSDHKRGRPFGDDLRTVVNALLYVAKTGCQWRLLPTDLGPWTRAWSQFRRWSRNDTWARIMAALHKRARVAAGRDPRPSMIVIDTHLARGSSNGGATFHNKGGPYGMTKGAKRVVAVDVTGLPLAAFVVPAGTHENDAVAGILNELTAAGYADRLELVLADYGVTARTAAKLSRKYGLRLDRVGWPDKSPVFRPIHLAWRVEVAHGLLMRSRRLSKSFENTTVSASAWLRIACVTTLLKDLPN